MLLILILAAILLCGSEVHESCQRAMRLWRDNLIPGMLLPMILVRLIQARGGFDHLKLALFNKHLAGPHQKDQSLPGSPQKQHAHILPRTH